MFTAALIATVLAALSCRYVTSSVTIANQSGHRLEEVRIVLAETPELVIPVADLINGQVKRIRLPSGFGETSLRIEALAGGNLVAVECAYLEDAAYHAKVRFKGSGTGECEVRLA